MSGKLLYLVQPASFFESHRLHIALAAKKIGYEIHVITNGSLGTLVRLKSHGIQVHDLQIPRDKKGVLKEVISLWRIIKFYHKIRPDICHHVTMRMILFGMIASRFFPPKKIINAYSGLGFIFTQHTIKTTIARFLIQAVMRTCSQPERQFAIFQNLDDQNEIVNNKIENHYNSYLIKGSGVDISSFYYEPELTSDQLKIIFPARLLRDKGIIEFVEAIKIVKKTHPEIYVQLAGTPDPGNPSSIKQETLIQWLDEGIINKFGFVEDMAGLFRSSHIVCLPSYREGLPKSLLEAAASGRPIVTSDVPGCRELYSLESPYSIIVPDKDSLALADALIELLNSSEKRREFGLNARKIAEKHFNTEIIKNNTLQVYTGKLLLF